MKRYINKSHECISMKHGKSIRVLENGKIFRFRKMCCPNLAIAIMCKHKLDTINAENETEKKRGFRIEATKNGIERKAKRRKGKERRAVSQSREMWRCGAMPEIETGDRIKCTAFDTHSVTHSLSFSLSACILVLFCERATQRLEKCQRIISVRAVVDKRKRKSFAVCLMLVTFCLRSELTLALKEMLQRHDLAM